MSPPSPLSVLSGALKLGNNYVTTLPPLRAVGRSEDRPLKIADKVTVALEAAGDKFA
jgi:hypothetical protein